MFLLRIGTRRTELQETRGGRKSADDGVDVPAPSFCKRAQTNTSDDGRILYIYFSDAVNYVIELDGP